MGSNWVVQATFEVGHDIVEAAWDSSGRHVVIVRYESVLLDDDDREDAKRIVQIASVDNGESFGPEFADRCRHWSVPTGFSSLIWITVAIFS